MTQARNCERCGKYMPPSDGPESEQGWCSLDCLGAWEKANPEEAAKWITVRNMTMEQRALFNAMFGIFEGQS